MSYTEYTREEGFKSDMRLEIPIRDYSWRNDLNDA